jgi:hypothetical protein
MHDASAQSDVIQRLRRVEGIPGPHLRFPGAQSLADSRKRLSAWLGRLVWGRTGTDD